MQPKRGGSLGYFPVSRPPPIQAGFGSIHLWVILLLLIFDVSGCGPPSGGGQRDEGNQPVHAVADSRPGYLEDESVCGFWAERLLSAIYHFFAGRPNESRVAGLVDVERVAFMTKDHRELGGYKLRAYADASRSPRGYVLVALGNAMLADQVLSEFRFLQAEGFEIYIYDYRGYGLSKGKSRFFAIRSDYIELIQHLNGAGYANRFLYGMSIGGVFVLNAIGAGAPFDAALIDSPPSRISGYGCPRRFDPVENIPSDSSRLGFVFGYQDKVVPPSAWWELSEFARARGAKVFERIDLAHPMMDFDPLARKARFDTIRMFFTERTR